MTKRHYLPNIEAQLISAGLQPTLISLLAGEVRDDIELVFPDLKTAERIKYLLYKWFWHYPQVKEGVALSLNRELCILTIKLRALPERRGRRGSKII